MKIIMRIFAFAIALVFFHASFGKEDIAMNKNLTDAEKAVVFGKATEAPFTNKYDKFFGDGIYTCKVCNAALYKSQDKFDSGCGWPAFDDEFPNAVKRVADADGKRVEILCSRCGAHLGHVFEGERLTKKNVRHCVNSLSMNFLPAQDIGRAIVAGGCFWGVDELMRKIDGVISCVSGYAGGSKDKPTYREVCSGNTGHLEAVEILFDKSKTSYDKILKTFFEIHDFTQKNGQGPDIGSQYLSVIFAQDDEQKAEALKLIELLKKKGYDVATKVLPAATFYPAENYHQRYYEIKGTSPYCHIRKNIFD